MAWTLDSYSKNILSNQGLSRKPDSYEVFSALFDSFLSTVIISADTGIRIVTTELAHRTGIQYESFAV